MKSSKGLELWEKANGLIPGGNMLLSKHKNLFSPGKWPCYYSKAKGAKVWDLDGNEYGPMMAAASVIVAPLVIAFLLAQRRFIEGITLTGMK